MSLYGRRYEFREKIPFDLLQREKKKTNKENLIFFASVTDLNFTGGKVWKQSEKTQLQKTKLKT